MSPAPTSPLPGAVDAVGYLAAPSSLRRGQGPLAPSVTVDRDGLSSVHPNRVASFRAGIRLSYNWRKGSAAMSATHPSPLETRSKESNARASQRVLRNPAAQWKWGPARAGWGGIPAPRGSGAPPAHLLMMCVFLNLRWNMNKDALSNWDPKYLI